MSRLFYEKQNVNVSNVSGSSNVVIQNNNSTKETFSNFKIVPVFVKEHGQEILKFEIHRKQFLWFSKPIKITETIDGSNGILQIETNKRFDTLIEAKNFIKTLNN